MNKFKAKPNFALGLGSNLGSPELMINEAISKLKSAGVKHLVLADLIRTKPIDCIPGTPDFINTAAIGFWEGTPESLLELCQSIEVELGRPTIHAQNESRTIDLDILLFEGQECNSQTLTIPHPRMNERIFVLKPLNQIAPHWIIPKAGTVQDMLTIAQNLNNHILK